MARRLVFVLISALLACATGCQALLVVPVATFVPVFPSATSGPTSTPWPAFQTVAPPATSTPPSLPTLAPSRTPLPTSTATPVVLGAISFPDGVNPLTGQKAPDPAQLNRRPVMVKVSNFPRSGRPHAGLSNADIVFEYYIGEFENRFLAVYYSQNASRIGPLRSGRLVDAQLTNMFGGILVYGNADPRVDKVLVDQLGTRAITFDDAPCPPICGKDTHTVEGVFVNSGATTPYAVQQKIDNTRPDFRGLVFDIRPPAVKTPGAFLGVMFGPENRGEWQYDSASGKYLRWIEEERPGHKFVQIPLVDRNTGKQIGFENIIVLFTRYTELLPTMHEIEMAGNTAGQPAYYFRDGVITEGSWQSNGMNQLPSLLNSWGTPANLKPGNSWIILVGLSSFLDQVKSGNWELEFHTK